MRTELLYNILCLAGGVLIGILIAAVLGANGRDD